MKEKNEEKDMTHFVCDRCGSTKGEGLCTSAPAWGALFLSSSASGTLSPLAAIAYLSILHTRVCGWWTVMRQVVVWTGV